MQAIRLYLLAVIRVLIALILLVLAGAVVVYGWALLKLQADPDVARLVAGGTILAAIATAGLAVGTYLAVREAGRQATIAQGALAASLAAVEAANREAEASTKQAEASARSAAAAEASIAEVQRSRQLEYQPRLAFEDARDLREGDGIAAPRNGLVLEIRNVGRGPALDCVFAFHAFDDAGDHAFGASIRFDVGPGETVTKNAHTGRHTQLARVLTERELIHPPERVLVVAYRDVVDRRYRVLRQGFDYRTEDGRDGVRAGDPDEWATWTERS